MLENWHNLSLKRSFTAKCGDEEQADLLVLSKQALVRMQTEARDVYDEFLKVAIIELFKTLIIK